MAVRNSYAATFAGDGAFSAAFTYVLLFPAAAVLSSGGFIRAQLRAGNAGSFPWGNMFIGHKGAGTLDFDGGQVQLKVGGQSSGTVPAGQSVWTDPIAFACDETKPLIVTYDAFGVAGSNYRYGTTTGLEHHYKVGASGAALNGANARSGTFTKISNRTAVVEAIEVADAIEDFGVTPPPPPPDPDDDPVGAYPWFDAIKSDQLYSSGRVFAGAPGEMLVVGLFNTSGSGREVFLHQIDINADADTVASLHLAPFSAAGELVGSRCNLDFRPNSPASLAKVHVSSVTVVPEGKHAYKKFRGGVDSIWNRTPYPVVRIAPDYGGAILVLHSPGVGATVDFHWQERPI